ncbi:MAG: PA domain-containing protein, partial [Caulobacteraceae bacterium]
MSKLALLAASALLATSATAQPMAGFTDQGASFERALEAQFDHNLSPERIKARLELMASRPNQVGSPHDHENALYTLAEYRKWGWDAHIEEFSVLYPTPKREVVEQEGRHPWRARLTEPTLAADPSTRYNSEGLPAWNIYGADGDVTAPLVYVNYGMEADYKELRRLGVSVKGKIAIVRYGAGWRGLKPRLAYEHGAVGCIIYSDPADDGYATHEPYPEGGSRPGFGIQRGSVENITLYSGDPLTPGWGAT